MVEQEPVAASELERGSGVRLKVGRRGGRLKDEPLRQQKTADDSTHKTLKMKRSLVRSPYFGAIAAFVAIVLAAWLGRERIIGL